MNKLWITATVILLACSSSFGAVMDNKLQLFVAVDGNDNNLGTQESPLRTLTRAKELVRQVAGTRAIEVTVAGGTYYLPEPLMFSGEDSGTEDFPVVWRGHAGSEVRLLGGRPLDLKWEAHTDRIYKASVPEGTQIDQLFFNGKRQILARYPNDDPEERYFNGAAPTWERMKQWENPETAYIHALHSAKWGSGHIVLKRDDQGELYEYIVSIDTTTAGDRGFLNTELRFAENVFEELDSDNEWFFDQKKNTLYYQPKTVADLNNGVFENVSSPHLVRFSGTSAKPARFITFDGFTFAGAAPTWKLTQDHLPNGGDFVVHRGGAFTLEGTEDCTIRNCTFTELGGNAVFINGYNRRAAVVDCLIRNIGANGIALCGAKDAMRGDQFYTVLNETIREGNQVRQKWEKPEGWFRQPDDLTPGPKTENYPSECLIEGNLITVSGEYEKQSAAILLSMTKDNTIRYNTAFKLPRAGIVMNDCSWSGNIIEHNDIFDTVRETADHGPFNSWGKDRYWIWANHHGAHSLNPNAKKYALIDALTPNHIRNNRFSHPPFSSHSWGIDLDDGSTNFKIYNNLTLGCAIKIREGFHRTVENNIFIGDGRSTPARHLCFEDNEDVYRHNIIVNRSSEMVEKNIKAQPDEMDYKDKNLYYTTVPNAQPTFNGSGIEVVRNQLGQELESIVGDPMFVDPGAGDYRVKPESPAIKLGFKNFPMDFGVTSPRLKALLPDERWFPKMEYFYRGKVQKREEVARNDNKRLFMGAVVKNMTDETEKSAVGIGEITGVLVLEMSPDSPLAKAGIEVVDLIIACNGQKVDLVEDLQRLSRLGDGNTFELEVHDDSRKRTFMVQRAGP